MKDIPLTLSNALGNGWQKAIKHYWVLFGALALLLAIMLGFNMLDLITNILGSVGRNLDDSGGGQAALTFVALFLSLGFTVARYAVQNLTSIGLTRIQLNILDEQKASVGQLFQANGVFWQYLGATILYALIVVGGLLLLIVPGIIWAIKYQFAPMLVVDKKMGPVDALKRSGVITKGHKGWLLGYGIVLFFINLAGLLALLVGLVLTVPWTMMASIWVYRKLETSIETTKTAVATA